MPDTTVKYFNSAMTGAPTLSGEAGKLIAVLDACLIDGFGSVTLDSLVVASNVATGTVSAGHNFAMVGNTGPVVTIAGATPSALNGEWRIASVPSSTTFTFSTTGINDQTATGTINAIRSPAGWTKLFSATNKAVYQRSSLFATAMVLQVVDNGSVSNGGQTAGVQMYESMSNVDTGIAATPGTLAGSLWWKSAVASSATRPWALFADSISMHLFLCPSNDTDRFIWFPFGDLITIHSVDTYHCIFASMTQYGSTGGEYCTVPNLLSGSSRGCYIAKDVSQVGSAIGFTTTSIQAPGRASGIIGSGGWSYPGANGYLCEAPIWCSESSGSSILRGRVPGAYGPLHSRPLGNFATVNNLTGLENRTLVAVRIIGISTSLGEVHLDVTGPWH